MFGLGRKKKEEVVEYSDKNLYILAEIPKPGIITYLEANGIHVKKIVTSIDAMILSLIKEKNPIRLLIVDFGAGKWKTLENIDNIVGLLEQCVTEDGTRSSTIFTNNGAITQRLRTKKIAVDIREYKGISDIVRALTEYTENYVTPGAVDFEGAPSSDLSSFVYKPSGISELKGEEKLQKFRNPTFVDISAISMDGDSMDGFNCKY